MGKRILLGCILALMIPYIVTLAWTGTVEGQSTAKEWNSGKTILIDRDNQTIEMDAEEYLIGVVARQIPADYGAEALRAQAVIARTYIYKQMQGADEIVESSLDMDHMGEKQMETQWGSEQFVEKYSQIEQAVRSTEKTVMKYEDAYIDPMFFRTSTGKTRTGDADHPYIQSVDSPKDVEAEDFLTIMAWSKEEFADKINSIPDSVAVTPDQLPQTIQLVEKDEAEYIVQIQIGTKTYTGEEVQYALGLPSCSFTLEEYEGKIRAVCRGIGHGYGLSQYGARERALEGWTAEDILSYFYKNIVLISE